MRSAWPMFAVCYDKNVNRARIRGVRARQALDGKLGQPRRRAPTIASEPCRRRRLACSHRRTGACGAAEAAADLGFGDPPPERVRPTPVSVAAVDGPLSRTASARVREGRLWPPTAIHVLGIRTKH